MAERDVLTAGSKTVNPSTAYQSQEAERDGEACSLNLNDLKMDFHI